jgi:uncharacterized protein
VTQPRHPLRINVGFLINQPIGTSRDIHFDFPSLNLPPDFEAIDFSGVVRVNRTQQGLLLQGNFKAKKVEPCVRCLADFLQPLQATFDELYAFSYRTLGESDAELILPEDANVELEPLVREILLVEVPISPVCKPDCKGLCPECGADLNTAPCEHVIEEAGSGS